MSSMKILLFVPLIILCGCASKKLTVDRTNYLWKNFSDSLQQSIDLNSYKSPNIRQGQDSSKLVVLSATGGGSRAAAFTIGVLLELERILGGENGADSTRNVLSEIDFFSTASGGGWGASTYIAHLYQKNKYANDLKAYPFTTYNSYEPILANIIDRAYAKHQLRYFLNGILSKRQNYVSGAVIMDRLNTGYLGWGLRAEIEEQMWRRNNSGIFDKDSVEEIKLSDVFILQNSPYNPSLPMLIPNATNLTNYMVVPFSPDRLRWWGLKQYTYTTKYGPQLYPEPADKILTTEQLLEIPLAAGIKASSSVPGFIGSTTFLSQRQNVEYSLRLEDGGITDNFGLHTVYSILRQEKNINESTKRIVIVVDASGAGIKPSKQDANNISRFNSVIKFAAAAPDAQYPLLRERIATLEKDQDCTVIYLGTEVLLDSKLGGGGEHPENISIDKKQVENIFYKTYVNILKDPNSYNLVPMSERAFLFEYVNNFVPTWFSAKNTNNSGKYLEELEDVNGTGRIMTLAGRSVVQLKKDEIMRKFGISK